MILIIGNNGTCINLLQHISNEGEECIAYIKHFPKIHNKQLPTLPSALAMKPDLVLFAMEDNIVEANLVASHNIPALGYSALSAMFTQGGEGFKTEFCQLYGIRIPKKETDYYFCMDLDMWFSRGKLLYQAGYTLNQFRFLAGNLGPMTPGECSVFIPYRDRRFKLIHRVLKGGFEEYLEHNTYSGPLKLRVLLGKNDLWPYYVALKLHIDIPTILAQAVLGDFKLSEALHNIANGAESSMYYKNGVGVSVTISKTPYPVNHQNPHTYISAKGTTIREAIINCSALIDEIDDGGIQYRIDAGVEQNKQLNILKSLELN